MTSPLLSSETAVSSYRESSPKIPRLVSTVSVLSACVVVPSIVYSQLGKVLSKEDRSWFIYHPFLMSMGVIGLPLAAILQQRLFDYTSNKIHMYTMMISLLLILTGAYVIISNKNMKHENHFTTTHGRLGLITITWFLIQSLAGFLGLDPDNRISFFRPTKRFRIVRRLHTIGGRGLLLMGYLTAFIGYSVFFAQDIGKMIAVYSVLGCLSGIALYDPIRDWGVYLKTKRRGLVAGRGA